MILIFIGSLVGLLMALTGAGGALVSIPLFIEFMNLPFKEATILSLLAVFMASVTNFFFQRKKINYKLCLGMFFFSTIGSMISIPLKNSIPDKFIVLFLIVLSIFSLFGVWFPVRKIKNEEEKLKVWLVIATGISIGIIATLTGIGGGVLLVPVFVLFFPFHQEEAVVSSLFIIALSSLFSFLVQLSTKSLKIPVVEVLYLSLGILCISFAVKMCLSKISIHSTVLLRKYIFTLVVLFTVYKLL